MSGLLWFVAIALLLLLIYAGAIALLFDGAGKQLEREGNLKR